MDNARTNHPDEKAILVLSEGERMDEKREESRDER
jgi:hypothetical protein